MKMYILYFLIIVYYCAACNDEKEDENDDVGRKMIMPFTKWCGVGDIAKDYDDLGYDSETDRCCREHDHCDDYISSGDTQHGLHNSGFFTRSHCKCDKRFLECLEEVDTLTASAVGVSYFNKLGMQCYKQAPPATCLSFETFFGLGVKCLKYDYDYSEPDEWQWFDNPRFTNTPSLW